MRTASEIMDRIAEIEYVFSVDEEAYLDEGEQAETAALRWVLDKHCDEVEISSKARCHAQYQGLLEVK